MRKKLFFILALLLVAAMGAMAQSTYTVSVKEGTADANNWSSDPEGAMTTGVAANTSVAVTYTGSKMVKGVKARKNTPAPEPTIDLSTVTGAVDVQNDAVLTGKLTANVKISIEDGATVTLAGVTINGANNDSYKWAGITCKGDATIILQDGTTNTVKGFQQDYPGIYVPENKTLIIKGTGTLTASSSQACGIGSGFNLPCGNIEIQSGVITATGGAYSAGIGSYGIGVNTQGKSGSSCGNITISGGTVTATGGTSAAGIGSGSNGSSCGNITITGGTVTANVPTTTNNNPGYTAAGIGSGGTGVGTSASPSSCGNITIDNTVISVTAFSKYKQAKNIGAGLGGTCGTVTVGGTVGAIRSNNNSYTYNGTGTQPQEDVYVTVNKTGDVEWTLTMPQNNVELEIEYFNATAPTAATGDIFVGESTALVTAGTTTGCTMMYKRTDNDTRPTSTEGFTSTVPTAEGLSGPGTYYVWYYVTEGQLNSPILGPLSVTVSIDKSALKDAIDYAQDYYNSIKDSHPTQAAVLSEAIDVATNVWDDDDATLTEVANAKTTLINALNTAIVAVAQSEEYSITVAESTEDKDNWTISATSAKAGIEVPITYTASKMVKSVKAKMVEEPVPTGKTINLSEVLGDVVAQNGDVLTGELTAKVKISIVPGATVTLAGVIINGLNSDDSGYPWAGITCLGDATIILQDNTDNTVTGFNNDYPGIQPGPANTTLIIKGTGKLTASSNGNSAGIGGGKGASLSCGNITIQGGNITAKCNYLLGTGIGSGGIGSSCGNITISGGTVTANGTSQAAGIGCGGYGSNQDGAESSCGDIIISGGTVNATGGGGAAGIGSGFRGGKCGNITISGGTVTAMCSTNGEGVELNNNGAGIGSGGYNSSCGNITISGGTVNATGGTNAAGIGSGAPSTGGSASSCGNIKITAGVTKVTATKGSGAPNHIGAGNGSSCGTVTIPTPNSTDQSSYVYEGDGSGDQSGSQPQEGVYATVTKTGDTEWTLTMPASRVELAMSYFDVTPPAAKTDAIIAGGTTALVTAGAVTEEDAVMMYAVTENNTKPTSTEDFSATVPTAEGLSAGTYYVWYYIDATPDVSQIAPEPIEVTVETFYPVESVDISQSEATLVLGRETVTLTSTAFSPENASYKNVTWESSDPTVVTVASVDATSGKVSTVGIGKATITMRAKNGTDLILEDDATAVCVVTVVPPSYTVSLDDGNVDPTNWKAKADNGQFQMMPLEGVTKNQTVTVKYNGRLKVKSVTAKLLAAQVSTAPKATQGDISRASDTPLVSTGVATNGTMMYVVTTENKKPASIEGFSATVPTAQTCTEAGTYYVWYYAKGDATYSDSDISDAGIEVTVTE